MSAHPALQRFLSRLLLRSELNDGEVEAILDLPFKEVKKRGRYAFVSPGQTVDFSCLVAEGLVSRFDLFKDGRRQITDLHVPGDMCDLHSVAIPVAGWGIEAVTDATVLQVPHKALRETARAYPALALAFWRDTTADLSISSKWVGVLGRRPAVGRIAHLLCEMGLRLEQAGLGTRHEFSLPITQEQLSEIIGMTAVHVNRSLQQLRSEGIVQFRRPVVSIVNLSALQKIAEFDDTYLVLASASERQREREVAQV